MHIAYKDGDTRMDLRFVVVIEAGVGVVVAGEGMDFLTTDFTDGHGFRTDQIVTY
jgi:hypothetical protein